MNEIIGLVRDKMRSHDLRITPQRQAILEILLSNKDAHLSVEDIYQITREQYPEIGLATIYRTVDLFCDLGIVNKLEFGDKGALYEFRDEEEGHYHHHLICTECGKIIEFNMDLLEELEKKVSEESDFHITNHKLRFYGICSECRRKVQ